MNIQTKEANTKIHDELAMKVGLTKEEMSLIWTIKHALRWLMAKNPESHPRIEMILGMNNLLYFDEKKNRLLRYHV